MARLFSRLNARLKKDGWRRTIGRACDRLTEPWHEWRLGLHSSPYVRMTEIGIDDPDYHDYEPTQFANIRRIFGSLTIDPGRDVFLDYGAGMGRMMVMAAMEPFRRVIGIELTEQFSAIARANLDHLRRRFRCPQVELITADACDFVVPPDVTVIYIYHAFSGKVLARVLERIRQSLDAAPRKTTVIYCAPPECRHDPLGAPDWLLPPRKAGGSRDRTIYFYQYRTPARRSTDAAEHCVATCDVSS